MISTVECPVCHNEVPLAPDECFICIETEQLVLSADLSVLAQKATER